MTLSFGIFPYPPDMSGCMEKSKTQRFLHRLVCGSPVIQKFPKPRFPTFGVFTKYRCRHPSTPAPPGAPLTPGMSSWVILDQNNVLCIFKTSSQAPSYASPKLRPSHLLTYLLTGVKCRATSVAKNWQRVFLYSGFARSDYNWLCT